MSRKKKKDNLLIPTIEQVRAQLDKLVNSRAAGHRATLQSIEAELEALEKKGADPIHYLSSNTKDRVSALALNSNSLNSSYPALVLQHRDQQRRLARLAKVYNDETVFTELFGQLLETQQHPASSSICRHFWVLLRNPDK